ncbi:lysylphosphatidylglycerol synthase transmembrane domain-containing protein [Marinobacter halophilus]|uniref:TIGR00374 family protein n=1 Tax=Marinobacter halophilus TaxID=1323740 RepID=A0A2T1KDZ9_9GAMM|nr:lysylphosphatidylglycerol synthase transmembrane domain-containing protein [Marinobacter halophilus]PSF08347.1 TIGR00374 family protein [Marinobacter halophilus]GGC59836.1 membrane protein [Marinobacter halophilus]
MTSNTESDYQQRTSWRRLAVFSLIFLAMTAAGIYAVYDRFAGRSFEFDTRLASPTIVFAAIVLLAVYFLADGLRLHYTLRALGHKLPFRKLFKLVFINLFFSNVTPMATGGGFAQIWYLTRNGVPVAGATAATTIRTLLAVVFIFSLTPVFLLNLDALDGHSWSDAVTTTLAVLVCGYLGFFAILLFKTRWLIAPLSSLVYLLHAGHLINEGRYVRWQFRLRRELLRFAQCFHDYRQGRALHILLSIVFTAVFLLSLFSFPALLIHGLGYQVDYLVTLGLLVVTTFIMYFAPTPGASGISEGVFGNFFQDILSGNHLVLVTVVWRFLTIYLGMIVGLLVMQRDLIKSHRSNQ